MRLLPLTILTILALFSTSVLPASGRLVIVGGALSNQQDDIFEALLGDDIAREKIKAAVIPAASSKPSFYGERFRKELIGRGLTASNVRLLELAQKDDSSTNKIDESTWSKNADNNEIVEWIEACDIVWFTGGDQSRITATLMPKGQASESVKALHRLLERGGTIGGTSAGAAMMSATMIVGGNSEGALFEGIAADPLIDQEDGPLLLGEGLGFFLHGIIDQHFDAKARLGRLILAVSQETREETKYGFGIDENTAFVVDLSTMTATVAGAS